MAWLTSHHPVSALSHRSQDSKSAALHCTQKVRTSLQQCQAFNAPDVRHCKGSIAVLRIKRHPTSIVRDIDRAAPMAWEQLSAPCTTLSHCTRHAVRRRPYRVLRPSSAATQYELRKPSPAYWSQSVAYVGQIRRALLSRAAYVGCPTRSLPPCTPLHRAASAAKQARAEGCCDRA